MQTYPPPPFFAFPHQGVLKGSELYFPGWHELHNNEHVATNFDTALAAQNTSSQAAPDT